MALLNKQSWEGEMKKCYVLNFVGSGATSEIWAGSDGEAIFQAKAILGESVTALQWDADGENDDGEQCKRLLIWSSEKDALNDDGSKAIASLSTVGLAR
jgi:hypothetical protein